LEIDPNKLKKAPQGAFFIPERSKLALKSAGIKKERREAKGFLQTLQVNLQLCIPHSGSPKACLPAGRQSLPLRLRPP